ncbi:bifunctional folylpolyglutamate synthase/dihydrofolate synthase [Plebeiibacterium sediminum]|uniref:Dihydrofolate synthase/folylpolyglutamate synthase n=1 Tax=Plebeiibacterium sediminum TaxID=2992112 RepID=A0AAE3M586_9BACT|nr:folylpolyglutamate synthase/dihydrofolate synthase family protein [Plebeiobacterium sediminum]MCW3787496.1 bifunctional folylpolyglutamate synthase/dihydrofolate synthase [Plebeiobacterium sediminum]
MTYQEVLEFMFSQLPMYQRSGKAAYKANLDNTLKLDEYFNHPHQKFKTIHVAGTNGKGSVSHSLASVLHTAGYKVGLYTSPHLKDFRERIKINGTCIPEPDVIAFISENQKMIEDVKPSFFEMTVAMAFDYFAKSNVDIAVIEVGLGGRLDSTNIILPECSVITNIGLDHIALLGNTIDLIAREKAGIIKAGVHVVIGEHNDVTKPIFESVAINNNAPIYFASDEFDIPVAMRSVDNKQVFQVYKNDQCVYENLQLDLLGIYQKKNLKTILQTIEVLKEKKFAISKDDIFKGLKNVVKNTGLLGRWQILGANPAIICDTGHNEDGVKEIVAQLSNTAFKKLHIIWGMVNDKDINSVLALLPKNAQYYFVKPNIPRGLEAKELKKVAEKYGLSGNDYIDISEAIKKSKKNASSNDLIFIGGSTFVVADVV